MKNNIVLLIGTSFSAVPLLKNLKKEGCLIYVCGGLKDDPCHSYADRSFFIDYSNEEKLLQLCKDEEIDFIVPTCNDYSYNSASYVAKKLNKFNGFDDYETTMLLHTKNGFRNFTLKNNFPVPKAMKYEENLSLNTLNLDFPILVKPDYSFSGKGMSKVYSINELETAITYAKSESKNNKVVLEEFVEGNLHSHSAFIQDGKILIDFFVDEYCSVYPYQVDSSSLSSILTKEIKDDVRISINRLVEILNLKDGLLHTQFISSKDKFWLIETMRRCPGDLYGTLIKKSTEVDFSKFYCNPFLNKKNNIDSLIQSNNLVSRHTISIDKEIIFTSFNVELPLKNVQIFPLKNSGYRLDKAPYDKSAIIFASFNNLEELKEQTPKMKNYIRVEGFEIE